MNREAAEAKLFQMKNEALKEFKESNEQSDVSFPLPNGDVLVASASEGWVKDFGTNFLWVVDIDPEYSLQSYVVDEEEALELLMENT